MIYFDNNATTQPLPEVVEAMRPLYETEYANPSSVHQFGQSVRHRVEQARAQVAALIGASAREIVFTSGGTESINLAIRGALAAAPGRRRVLTTTVEHSAVLRVMEQLEGEGYDVARIGVDGDGRLDLDEWSAKLTDDTALASLQHANNETGVVFDVAKALAIAEERGVPVHLDAVQSVGKLSVDVTELPVRMLSVSAHKLHGPKGVGALFIRRRTRVEPLIVGGGQEGGRRGGTENVPGIVGMGVAAEAARRDRERVSTDVAVLRDALEAGLLAGVPGARVNGSAAPRIHNTTNIAFEGLQAEAILIVLSEAGICVSSGAACSSGSLEPSHVLKAMGVEERFAHGSIRFSLSRFNTRAEVDHAVREIPKLLSRLTMLRSR